MASKAFTSTCEASEPPKYGLPLRTDSNASSPTSKFHKKKFTT